MISKEKQEILDKVEYELSLIKDQDQLYTTFRCLLYELPNDSDLGKAVRLLFTSNIK